MLLIGFGLLEMAAAMALLRRKAWARVVLLGMNMVQVVIFPIGTVLGALTIWLLMTACKAADEPADTRMALETAGG